jgi:hypothetical protein
MNKKYTHEKSNDNGEALHNNGNKTGFLNLSLKSMAQASSQSAKLVKQGIQSNSTF